MKFFTTKNSHKKENRIGRDYSSQILEIEVRSLRGSIITLTKDLDRFKIYQENINMGNKMKRAGSLQQYWKKFFLIVRSLAVMILTNFDKLITGVTHNNNITTLTLHL